MNDPYWDRTRYNPNLRRDALYVAQQTGSGAAKVFWGAMLFAVVAFWPLWALHGMARAYVAVAWFGLVAIGAIWFLAAVTVTQGRKRGSAEAARIREALDIASGKELS